MSLFRRNSSLRVQELILPAPVWRLLPDPATETLAVELRDHEAHETRFTAVDLPSLKLRFEPRLCPEEAWWVGLEACAQGVLLVHGYVDPGTPLRSGLWALSTRTGELLWAAQTAQFCGQLPQGMLIREPADEQLQLVAPLSGETRPLQQTEHERQPQLTEAETSAEGQLRFPALLNEGSEAFNVLAEQIHAREGSRPVRQMDHLRHGNTELVSFYEALPAGEGLRHRLLGWRGKKRVLSRELAAETTALAIDPFILVGDRLLAVRERRILLAAQLGSS